MSMSMSVSYSSDSISLFREYMKHRLLLCFTIDDYDYDYNYDDDCNCNDCNCNDCNITIRLVNDDLMYLVMDMLSDNYKSRIYTTLVYLEITLLKELFPTLYKYSYIPLLFYSLFDDDDANFNANKYGCGCGCTLLRDGISLSFGINFQVVPFVKALVL